MSTTARHKPVGTAGEVLQVGDLLAALSKWIDDGNSHRDPEAITWGRLAKVSEECGEVIAAYIGATGQNPRKGVTGNLDDVVTELLDVAVTALCAVEHLTDRDGLSVDRLAEKVRRVAARAGLAS
jgi:NTP pyrophosphatase (non-canonical NTP hydrolase)